MCPGTTWIIVSRARLRDLAVIPHKIENALINQRALDGYVDATAMCKASGKEFGHYYENKTTKAFLAELSTVIGIPITQPVYRIQGGRAELQGTWVHPDVAINLGQWCSPKFAVAVSQWVREWITGKSKIAIFLNDVQRKKAKKENEYGVSATFLPGHFKAYTVKLNPLDGVYYCDIRPNMLTDSLLSHHK